MVNEWMSAGSQTFMIGLAAAVWIIIAKLLVARYGESLPSFVRDLVALI